MFLFDWRIDIDSAIEGTAFRVVTTIDGTLQQFVTQLLPCLFIGPFRVIYEICVFTLCQIVHIGLIDITRFKGLTTIRSAEDTANLDGGANRHIHHGATGNALFVAATIGGTQTSSHQVGYG